MRHFVPGTFETSSFYFFFSNVANMLLQIKTHKTRVSRKKFEIFFIKLFALVSCRNSYKIVQIQSY